MMQAFPPADALLAIDIGNTRIGLGVWDGDGIHDTQRVPLAHPEQWRAAIATAVDALRGATRAVVIASVNPPHTRKIRALLSDITRLPVLCVRDDLPPPIAADVDDPNEIGVDRLCAAAAAWERIQGACAVASFGTAITVDCVSADGRFLGGTILPGLQLSCDALHTGTAQLPRIQPSAPTSVFGRNTRAAITGGVVYGAVGALREIVERFATELGEWPQLVLTGGNAALVAELADFVDAVVPDLCLLGIALAYRKAAGQP